MQSYSDILQSNGFEPVDNGIWISVGSAQGIQGWKLHLSTIQVEAPGLLEKVLPVLRSTGIPFKIARDTITLAQLNEGELGASQVGKFMTIYPNSEEESVSLARILIASTRGMHGPLIPSDIKLGDIVYARYGSYNPINYRDKLGQISSYIYDGEGNLFADARSIPFVLPKGISNPFADCICQLPIENTNGLLGPGYRIIDVIRQHAKGDIYQAIDLRSQSSVSIKVLKQGKQFCLSDMQGRDIRDRLKYQSALHQQLHGLIRIPAAGDYFEVNGDGYLPIQYIEGVSIENFVYSVLQNRPWHLLAKEDQHKILHCLLQLVAQLKKLHTAGYIHRDISASNVWITEDREVYLIDLELVWQVGSTHVPFGNGTPGFISPNQQQRKKPEYADDIYALGCVILLSLAGIDPRKLLQPEGISVEKLKGLVKGLQDHHYSIISAAVYPDAAKRPSLDEIQVLVEEMIAADKPVQNTAQNFADKTIIDLLTAGLQTMFGQMPCTADGLWLSPKLNAGRNSGSLELRKSVHRGIAGTIYLLARIKKHTQIVIPDMDRIQRAADWCASEQEVADANMPGLYFGDAGVAMALSEAIDSGLIENSAVIAAFIGHALNQQTDWLDITHGMAGQGVAHFYLNDLLQNGVAPGNNIRHLARYLIRQQSEDGSWVTPEGVDGISGETLTGFAHGVSGIIYFLAEYAYRYNDAAAIRAVEKAVQWLTDQSYDDAQGKLRWNYSLNQKAPWNWWCHGGPGIALTYLRLYELSGEKSHACMAEKALEVHADELVYANLSQCHGLSGLGEVYLEAYRVLKAEKWLQKANGIAQTIFNLRFEQEKNVHWMVEDPNFVTPDMMMGMGGVLHFYLRLLLKAHHIGFPLLFNPLKKPGNRLLTGEGMTEKKYLVT